VGDLEERLRRLELRLVWQPSAEDYLDASNRERVRALHALAERLAPYGFDGDYLFTKETLRMLAEDTPVRRERDHETIEARYRAQGRDWAVEAEGAREKLLAMLETRGRS
jgi:hypothetical protein